MRSLKQRPHALKFPKGEGRTEQAHTDEANINTIMAKARRGELMDFAPKHEPHYGDATGPQYLEANIIIAEANSMFEELPAALRSRFDHNPAKFLEFVQTPGNEEELWKLKLTTKAPVKEKLSIVQDTSPEQNIKPSEKTTVETDLEIKGETK